MIQLMRRYDTKFIFSKDKLADLLNMLQSEYRILKIKNRRISEYETTYYDTDNFYFFYQHHNNKLNRYKVRYRNYNTSNLCFLELKFKTNRGQIIKTRVKANSIETDIPDQAKQFLGKEMTGEFKDIINTIKPVIGTFFQRITLIHKLRKERITIDIGLSFSNQKKKFLKTKNLIVAELKQEKLSMNSLLRDATRFLGINSMSFSKYCIGSIVMNSDIKYNRFKKQIMALQKIEKC